jgi:hypothetical protein
VWPTEPWWEALVPPGPRNTDSLAAPGASKDRRVCVGKDIPLHVWT